MSLHATTDMFLAVGQLSVLLVAPLQDTILLVYAFFLIRGLRRKEQWAGASTSKTVQERAEPATVYTKSSR